MNKELCLVCTKVVYPTERVSADEKVYHKGCFRCKQCNNVLKLGSYASMEGQVFCKPCFKKLFFSKGNYSEGFGKLKPQQEHDLKMGRSVEPAKPFQGFSPSPTTSPAENRGDRAKEASTSTPPTVHSPAVHSPATHSPAAHSPAAVSSPSTSSAASSSAASSAATSSAATSSPSTMSPAASPALSHTETTSTPKLSDNAFLRNQTTASPSAAVASPPQSKATSSPKSPAAAAGAAKPGGANKCEVCGKTAYPMEKTEADGKTFHKTCFRCKQCNSVLKLGSFAAMNGEFFCKVCFKKNFFSKGNYSDGFGLPTPQEQHNAKTGKEGAAVVRPTYQGTPSRDAPKSSATPVSPPAVVNREPAQAVVSPPAVVAQREEEDRPSAPKETDAQKELRLLREAEERKEQSRREEEERSRAQSHHDEAPEPVQVPEPVQAVEVAQE